jgi:signal transduction histidine kinase
VTEASTAPAPSGVSGLQTTDLVEFNRWLSVTRLRATGILSAFTTVIGWLGIGNVHTASVLAVCGALALVSVLGLATSLPRRRPLAFFYWQSLADLAGVTLGIMTATQGRESILFSFVFGLVIVPMSLVSVTSGLVAAATAGAGHLLILGVDRGFEAATFTDIDALAFPVLFFLVAQQCFFYGVHLARKNATLAGLAARLEEKQHAVTAQARTSQALFDVARTLASTMDGPELLSRLNATVREQLDADWAATFLVDGEREVFRLAATSDLETPLADLVRLQLPMMGWPAASALQAHDVVPLTGPQAQRVPIMFTGGRRYDTVLLAGFRQDEALVGFLAVGFAHLDEAARARGAQFLRGIAQHASIVLRNARLLEEVRFASDMKSEFVGAISHELRSPLNVTLGYLEMLEDGAFGPVADEQRQVLHTVRQESLALLEMITALLDLNRLEAGRLPVATTDVDVRALFDEICGRLPADWRRPTVSITVDVAPNVPIVRTDAGKLKTVVRNLLHNALKFTDRGWVALSAGMSPAGDLVIGVRDTGCGIPPEALTYVFDMFRQVPGSGGGGVGLGLHLVRRLVDVLGGTVSVESQAGRGTAFTITLRREEIAPEDTAGEAA